MKKLDLEVAEKKYSVSGGSRPTSSHSTGLEPPQVSGSEAPSALGGAGETIVRQKPKVNSFGDAKPRELLLEQKGLDWKKIDLKLDRRVDRPETEEEKNSKEEIEQLKKKLPKEKKMIKKAAQGEKLRPPKHSKDEIPPPVSLQASKRGHHMGDYIPPEELDKFLANM